MKEQTPKHQLDFIEHCLMIQQARTIRTTISPWHFLFPQVSRNGIYHRFPIPLHILPPFQYTGLISSKSQFHNTGPISSFPRTKWLSACLPK
ncbi:hypothetical protein BRADI_1g61063v3 [Brachypodium distachyon]|uniref:Uncharacterized protein n=1 Tax=Brachypodium distachyon TaxID=15368 RepID=A0A2K2DSR3_BRADI|nr:hypothetical protein BRADI_1g61063v3 [Brachypodium distachyon]